MSLRAPRGKELGWSGTVNRCERLINVVIVNKPKVLRGLDQKVRSKDGGYAYLSVPKNRYPEHGARAVKYQHLREPRGAVAIGAAEGRSRIAPSRLNLGSTSVSRLESCPRRFRPSMARSSSTTLDGLSGSSRVRHRRA